MVDYMDPLDLPALLREAGSIVAKENGWVQGFSCTSGYDFGTAPGYCATGAVTKVSMKYQDHPSNGVIGYSLFSKLCDTLNDYVLRTLPEGTEGVVEWNDWGDRKQQEVVEAFERAAQLCEREMAGQAVELEPEQAVEHRELAYA